jgi:hypothetical protein
MERLCQIAARATGSTSATVEQIATFFEHTSPFMSPHPRPNSYSYFHSESISSPHPAPGRLRFTLTKPHWAVYPCCILASSCGVDIIYDCLCEVTACEKWHFLHSNQASGMMRQV